MLVRQLYRTGGILAAGRVINIFTQFAFSAIIVRALLKQDVAFFLLTFNLVSFLSLMVAFGAANIAIRKFSEVINNDVSVSSKNLLIAFLSLNLLTTLFVVLFFLCLVFFNIITQFKLEFNLFHSVLIVIWFWAIGLQLILTEVFRAFGLFVTTSAVSGVIVNVANLFLIGAFFLVEQNLTLELTLFTVTINTLVVTIISLLSAFRICDRFDIKNLGFTSSIEAKSIFKLSKEVFKESTPSFVNKLGLQFTVLADIWLVSLFYSKAVVADYGIAMKLAASLSVFLSISNGLVPTFIARLRKDMSEQVEAFLRVLATIVAIPTFIFGALFYMYSDIIIEVIFGVEYITATYFLYILLSAQIINVSVGSCSYALVMDGRNRQLMNISLVTGGAAIFMAVLCVSLGLGSISIAWAFALGTIARNILVYLAAKKICGIDTSIYYNYKSFLKNYRLIFSKSN